MQYQENDGYRKLNRLRKYLSQVPQHEQRTEEHTDEEVSCLCDVLEAGFRGFFSSLSAQEVKLDFCTFSFPKCVDFK